MSKPSFSDRITAIFSRKPTKSIPQIYAEAVASQFTGQNTAYDGGLAAKATFDPYLEKLSRNIQASVLKKSPLAKAVCRRTALYLSSVPLTFNVTKPGSDRYQPMFNHFISQVLTRPNKNQTQSDFVFDVAFNLMWFEQVYIVLEKNPDDIDAKRFPVLMFAISPALMKAKRVRDKIVYELDVNGVVEHFEENQVIDVSYKHESKTLYSVGLAESLYNDVVIEQYARRQIGQFYGNGANFSGVVSMPTAPNSEESMRIRKELEQASSKGAYRVMLLSNGATWQNVVSGNIEVNTIPVLDNVAKSFASVSGFPLALLNQSSANLETELLFWNAVGVPMLTKVVSAIDMKLGFGFNERYRINFSTKNIEAFRKQRMEETRIRVAEQTTGLRTPNEIRKDTGEPDYMPSDVLKELSGMDGVDESLIRETSRLLVLFANLPAPVFKELMAKEGAVQEPGRPNAEGVAATPSLPMLGTAGERDQSTTGEAQMIDTTGQKTFDLKEIDPLEIKLLEDLIFA